MTPAHEFQIDAQAGSRGQLTQRGEVGGESRGVRVVAGNRHATRAQIGGCVEHRRIGGDVDFGQDWNELDVMHRDAFVRENTPQRDMRAAAHAATDKQVAPAAVGFNLSPTASNPARAACRTNSRGGSSNAVRCATASFGATVSVFNMWPSRRSDRT